MMKKNQLFSIVLGVIFSLSFYSLNAQVSYTSCSNNGGTNASALGNNSTASGNYSYAFGYYTKATAANSYSFGSGNSIIRPIGYLTNDIANSFLIGFDNTPVFIARLMGGVDIFSSDLTRVGIGKTNPRTALDVAGTIRTQDLRIAGNIKYLGTSMSIDAYSEDFIGSMPQGYQPLLTLKDGKVGILNANPTAALDVGGDMKVQGFEINKLKVGNRIEFSESELSFIKTSSGGSIVIEKPNDPETKSGEQSTIEYIMTLKSSGVGIGTNNPSAKLHVSGNSYFSGTLLIQSSSDYSNECDIAIKNKWFLTSGASNVIGHNWRTNPGNASDMARAYNGFASAIFFDMNGNIRLRTAPSGSANSNITESQWKEIIMDNNGNLGIGTSSPQKKLHVVGDSYFNGNVGIGTSNPSQKLHVDGNSYFSGNIGIGTTNPQKKLHVAGDGKFTGTVSCSKVVVEITGASNVPDYVFEADYDLMSLQEVENFIQEHKHLPEIPSATQVTEEGLSLSDMNLLLLKKVEELTLYIIEQEKRIETLEKTINQ